MKYKGINDSSSYEDQPVSDSNSKLGLISNFNFYRRMFVLKRKKMKQVPLLSLNIVGGTMMTTCKVRSYFGLPRKRNWRS
jgi:hypothetical protein